MSLIDNVRQTLTDVSDSVMAQSQHLSSQAKLQVAIKKLQLERAKRVHELGNKTFSWYQSGNLTVGGPVPADVAATCSELADLQRQLDDTNHQLEEVKRLAEEARRLAEEAKNQSLTANAAPPTPAPAAPPTPGTPPPAPAATSGPPAPKDNSTQVLGGTPGAAVPPSGSNGSDVMRS